MIFLLSDYSYDLEFFSSYQLVCFLRRMLTETAMPKSAEMESRP